MKINYKYIGTHTPPKKQTEGSAGIDLFHNEDKEIRLKPGESSLISTGLFLEIPEGYVGIVATRSSLGFKYNCTLTNSIGVIDSDYRGEIIVKIINHGNMEKVIEPYERVAQIIIMPFLNVELNEVDELSKTERGSGGFGSTGKH